MRISSEVACKYNKHLWRWKWQTKPLPYALYIFGPKSGLTKKSGNLERDKTVFVTWYPLWCHKSTARLRTQYDSLVDNDLFTQEKLSWRIRSFCVNDSDVKQELAITLRLNFLNRPSWCILVTEHCSSDLQTCTDWDMDMSETVQWIQHVCYFVTTKKCTM